MSYMILVLLATAWAVFLLTPYLRRRASSRPSSSVTSFNRHLSILARTSPGGPDPSELPRIPVRGSGGPSIPRSRAEARRRRRDVLLVLSAAAVLSLVPAVALGGLALVAHLVIDAALATYVYLLVQIRKAAERRTRVTPLHRVRPAGDQALLVRRVASS